MTSNPDAWFEPAAEDLAVGPGWCVGGFGIVDRPKRGSLHPKRQEHRRPWLTAALDVPSLSRFSRPTILVRSLIPAVQQAMASFRNVSFIAEKLDWDLMLMAPSSWWLPLSAGQRQEHMTSTRFPAARNHNKLCSQRCRVLTSC